MNRSISPKTIGAFVIATLLLFIALILFFGSAKLFSQSIRYILFFDNTVNGLNVGSPVKYKGVPVGIVERILIRVEGQSENSTSIPVIVKIDRSRLTNRLGTSVEVFEPKFIHEMIENGLIAQLSVESHITGQLFVEFSLQPDSTRNFVKHRDGEYGMIEIPTLPSAFCEITDDIGRIISLFAEFDYQKTYQNINAVLENLATVLEGLNIEELSQSFIEAIDQITLLLESGELEATLLSTRSTLKQVEKTVLAYDLESEQMAATKARLDQTLDQVNSLFTRSNALIAPESALRHELQNSFRELRQAAQSLRLFINYLERNPNALLTGRPEESH